MSQLGTIADKILDAVHRAPGCQVDDLVLSATEFDCVVGCPRCHNLMVEETFVDLAGSVPTCRPSRGGAV